MTTEYLYQQEVDRVLSALMPQNQLIVRVMLQNGMRLSDVLNLRSEALVPSGWYTESKTGKKRRYGLSRPLLEAIKEQAGPEWVFPGRWKGTHKTRQAVWKDIKRAAVAFRLPQNVGAHSFRKVYAVKLMKKYGKTCIEQNRCFVRLARKAGATTTRTREETGRTGRSAGRPAPTADRRFFRQETGFQEGTASPLLV